MLSGLRTTTTAAVSVITLRRTSVLVPAVHTFISVCKSARMPLTHISEVSTRYTDSILRLFLRAVVYDAYD